MSNSVNIDGLLTAVDQATRPFKSLETANVSLSDGIKKTEKNLRGLYGQVAQIDSFTRAQRALSDVSGQLKTAKEQARSLATEMKNSDAPTRSQTKALEKARDSVSKLSQQHNTLRLSVKNQRQSLRQAGISSRAPLTAKNRLHGQIGEQSEQLTAQRQALRLQNRQARVAKLQKGKEAVDAMGAKVSAVGNVSMSIARTGFDWGKKLLQPGYEQSLKNAAASESAGKSGATNASRTAHTLSGAVNLSGTAKTVSGAVNLSGAAKTVSGAASSSGAAGASNAATTLTSAANTFRTAAANSASATSTLSSAAGSFNALGVFSSAADFSGAGCECVDTSGTAIALTNAAVKLSATASALSSAAVKFSSAASNLSSTVITLSGTVEASSTTETLSGAADASGAVSAQGGNLGSDLAALQAAYQSLSFDLFSQQEASLRKLVQTATEYVGKLQQWVGENQGLTQTLGLIATVVIGVAGAIGTVASVIAPVFTGISTLITFATTFGSAFTAVGGAIMTVLGSLTLPILAIIAAIATAAAAVYFFWEPISAFFGGVVEGIKAGFAPLAELFTPFQPVFDAIGQAIGYVKNLFSELPGPISFSQQTLETFANVGKLVGQALVMAFTMPLQMVKWLKDGINWALEKLHLINKQPAIEMQKPQPQPTAGGMVFGAIQPNSVSNYQAVKPAAGGSYVDQSKTDINITLQGDVSPGSENSRHIQDVLMQHENNKRANALSNFHSARGFPS